MAMIPHTPSGCLSPKEPQGTNKARERPTTVCSTAKETPLSLPLAPWLIILVVIVSSCSFASTDTFCVTINAPYGEHAQVQLAEGGCEWAETNNTVQHEITKEELTNYTQSVLLSNSSFVINLTRD